LLHGSSLRGPPIPSASGRRQYEGIENGGLDLFKAAVMLSGTGKGLLHDGFFSLPSSGRICGISILPLF